MDSFGLAPRARASALLRASLFLSGLVAACPRPGVSPEHEASDPRSAEVLAALQKRLDQRLTAVRDFTIAGTAREGAGVPLSFSYTFAQPRFARAAIGADQSVVFDGKALLALDHRARVAARMDASSRGDEGLLLALHQTFADFACEGWRPPLLRPGVTRAAASADGSRIDVVVPIDHPELLEERLSFRVDGSFLERRTLDREHGTVAWTRVLEEIKDPATGLLFPKRWERGGPEARVEVSLTTTAVNVGVAASSFSSDVPEGYTLQGAPSDPRPDVASAASAAHAAASATQRTSP